MFAEFFFGLLVINDLRSKLLIFGISIYYIYIIILTKHIIAGASVHARTYAYARKFVTC